MKPKMYVLFRKFSDGKLIAFFPFESYYSQSWWKECDSYMENEQYCSAKIELIKKLKKVDVSEYQQLLHEITNIYDDYNIVVLHRYEMSNAMCLRKMDAEQRSLVMA